MITKKRHKREIEIAYERGRNEQIDELVFKIRADVEREYGSLSEKYDTYMDRHLADMRSLQREKQFLQDRIDQLMNFPSTVTVRIEQ